MPSSAEIVKAGIVAAQPDRSVTKHGVVVLVIADPALRSAIVPQLAEHYHVIEAFDTSSTVAAIRQERPDVVIAECPSATATRELVESVKADAELRAIPVMTICADADAEVLRAAGHRPDDIVSPSSGTASLCARVRANVELGRLRRTTREQLQLVARTQQDVIRRLLTAEEDERGRLARELHDGIGQLLTACQLLLPQLRNAATASAAPMLGKLEQLTSDIARDLHRVAVTLRPTALDDLGLAATLEGYLEEWSSSTGIAVTSHFTGLDRRPSFVVETTVYRIVQEVLSNVAKHTNARNVALVAEQNGELLSVIVEDDGAGFEVEAELAAKPAAWGIAAMRERAALIGGEFNIESTAGQGTTVYLRIPIGPVER